MNKLLKSKIFDFKKNNINQKHENMLKIKNPNYTRTYKRQNTKTSICLDSNDSFLYVNKGLSKINDIFQMFNTYDEGVFTIRTNAPIKFNTKVGFYEIDVSIIVSPSDIPSPLVSVDKKLISTHSSNFGTSGVGKSIFFENIMYSNLGNKIEAMYGDPGDFMSCCFQINNSNFFIFLMYDLVLPELIFINEQDLISNMGDFNFKTKLDSDNINNDGFIESCCLQLLFPELDKDNNTFLFDPDCSFADKVSLGKMISI